MILIIGATGKVGTQLVAQLGEQGAPLRAATRDPRAAVLPQSVEVVRADLAEAGSLEPHLSDVEAAFLLWPFTSPQAAAELGPAVVEILARAVPRIVYLSAAAAGEQPDSFWTAIEREIQGAAAEWTFLRPVGFAANTLMWADQIRSGNVVRWPYGAARRALIHERDIAAVAARALTEDGHAGQRYVLTGPDSLTQIEQVQVIGAVLGRSLRWEELPREEARTQLAEAFGDAAFAETALDGWAEFVRRPEPVTSTVLEITGAPARTLAEWAVEHVESFR
ncbi:MAG: NAD(P)H-binding protein [Actinomycetota bacterium]|nr:NAD(P)H-binding protein [Actinomycetota bacterium]